MLCHDSLVGYYTTLHALKSYWQYEWETIENMMPYEKEIVLNLIMKRIKEEEAQAGKAQEPIMHPKRWDKNHGTANGPGTGR